MYSWSMKSRFAWKTKTELSVPTYSRHTLVIKVRNAQAKFMTALGSLYHSNLYELSNPTKSTQLQIELAITVNVGNVFVKATYNLEGDGPLVLSTYEYISFLSSIATTVHYPNTAIFYIITSVQVL